MTTESLPNPHQELLENDDKANELFDFVCSELATTESGSSLRHHKFYIASRAHHALEAYYLACALLEVLEKTSVTKIKFDFTEEYDDQGNPYLEKSAELFYVLENDDGSFSEEMSCSLYSSDTEDINDQDFLDYLEENPDADDLISQVGGIMEEWGNDDTGSFHETAFEKHNVMTAYKDNYPIVYPMIEKFILSNFVVEAKEKAPSRSVSKM